MHSYFSFAQCAKLLNISDSVSRKPYVSCSNADTFFGFARTFYLASMLRTSQSVYDVVNCELPVERPEQRITKALGRYLEVAEDCNWFNLLLLAEITFKNLSHFVLRNVYLECSTRISVIVCSCFEEYCHNRC